MPSKKYRYQYQQVKLNFSPEQYEIISSLAENENMSNAHFCISKLPIDINTKNMRKRKKRVDARETTKVDKKLLFYLSNISSNVNQIAKRVNSSNIHSADILSELIKISTYIEEVRNDN